MKLHINVECSATKQLFGSLMVETRKSELVDLTHCLEKWILQSQLVNGLLTIFCRHTSASLLIQENTDKDVQYDLVDAFEILAPKNRHYRHSDEGADDMPAHIRTALSNTSLSIPIMDRRMLLGMWQAIYLFEHRDHPHKRELVVHYVGS